MGHFKRAEKKTGFVRIAIMILIFFGLVAVTFSLLRPLEITVRSGITGLRDNFIQQVKDFTGLQLEYSTANPSFLGSLDINNIRLLRPDSSLFLSISRLRLYFSFWDLISGKINLGVHSVSIDKPILSFDSEKDAKLYDLVSGSGLISNPGAPSYSLIPNDLQLRIRSGECDIQNGNVSAKMLNFNLDGNIHDNRIVFNARLSAQGSVNSLLNGSMNARGNGDFNLKNMEGNATLNIPAFSGDSFRLQPLSVSFLLKNGKLEIRKIYDRLPLDISAVWDTQTGALSCSLVADNFSPRDLITLTGPLKNYNTYMAARLSGKAGLENGENGFDYTIEANAAQDSLKNLPGRTSIEISADGNGKAITFRNLLFSSSMGTVHFNGIVGLEPFAPDGMLSFSDINLQKNSTGKTLNGLFDIKSSGQDIDVLATYINCGGTELSDLNLNISMEKEGLTFQCSADSLESADSADDGQQPSGSFFLEGSMDYNPGRIQASLKLDSFSAGSMLSLADPFVDIPQIPDLVRSTADDILVTTEVFFTTDYEHILYNAPALSIIYEGRQKLEADASLSGTDRRFELDQGSVSWDGGNADMSGYADFSDTSNIAFSLAASYKDLTYSVNGVILDMESVSIRGSYGLEAFFSSAGTGGYSGYVQGDNIPIPLKNQNASLSFLFSLRYDTASFWSAGIDRFQLSNIPAPVADAVLSFTGSADQDGALISNVLFENDLGLLSGTATAQWDSSYSEFSLNAGIADSGGSENYSLNANYSRHGGLELSINTEGMILDRISNYFTNGKATGNLQFSWEPQQSFSAELDLASVSFQVADQMLRGSCTASLDNSEFLLSDAKINYGSGFEASVPYFRFNRSQGIAQAKADASGSIIGMSVDLSLSADADFHSVNSWLDLPDIIKSFHGTLVMDTASFNDQAAEEPFRFVFSSITDESGPHISLDGGPRNMARLRYNPADGGGGNLYAALSAPFPIRGSFTGFISSKNIDISTNDLYVDMDSLWKFIPENEFIAFPGGIVAGSVQVVGPLRDPEFFGSVKATSLKIQVPEYLPEDIRPIPVTITMEGSEMRFGPVRSPVGTGFGMVSGSFNFERWLPITFRLDINVGQDSPIPVAFDIDGVHTKGKVSGNLILSMQDMIFDIYGDLVAQNTEITLDAAEMAAAHERTTIHTGPVSTMINIYIRSGRQVEFFWPSVEFPILQAIADVDSGIRVISDVIARRFSLTGDIQLRSGEIFYLERNFYLREGTLFFNENESRFEPRISARAEIRDQSDDGPVTISMVIDNAPLHSFTPRFESNPPLSQFQILSLLGQNQTGDPTAANQDTNVLLAYTADALTQFTVMRTLQREVRNFLGLDMFSLRTRLLQNFLFQATGLQANTGISYGTGNYFDNTTVFLGKYLGSNIFVESMFSWRYDPAKQDWGGLRLEPEISLEMKNPLFITRVNMLLLHPENWFINDFTVSLAWRWSF